jgi:poly(A) polymerase
VLLWEFNLFGELFPDTDKELSRDKNFGKFVHAALLNTDRRVATGHSVTPMFLLGVFLWAPVKKLAEQLRSKEKMSETQSLSIAAYQISGQQQSRISLPRRFTAPMREMLALQPRFDVQKGKRAYNLLEHRRNRMLISGWRVLASIQRVKPAIAGDGRAGAEVKNLNSHERATLVAGLHWHWQQS